jgi:uncharacterized membrane protein YbhN (UPF0104 family)
VKAPSVSWALKLLVSALVLALLLRLVPLRELVRAMGSVSLTLWVAVLVAFLGAHAAAAVKWRFLILGGCLPSPRASITAHFAGLTANLFLPGIAGGDVVRAGYLIRTGAGMESVAAAGVVDRVIDISALLLLGVAGAVVTHQSGDRAGRVIAYIATALAVCGIAGLAVLAAMSRRGIGGIIGRLMGALKQLAGRPARLGACLLASIAIQALFITLNALFGDAVGVGAPLSAWFTAWPLAKLVALAPISLAGLGVREAALVAFMQPFGAAPAPVMAAGLLWESVLVGGGLVGWLAGLVAAPAAHSAPMGPSS